MFELTPTTKYTHVSTAGNGAHSICYKVKAYDHNQTPSSKMIVLKKITTKSYKYSDFDLMQFISEYSSSQKLTERYIEHMKSHTEPCNHGSHFTLKLLENLSGQVTIAQIPRTAFCLAFSCHRAKPLNQFIDDNLFSFSLEQIKIITLQLLLSLSLLEEEEILHFDLKPENILVKHLNDLQKLKSIVIDLGLSETSPYAVKALKQTCWYRHPLIDFRVTVSHEADAWNLGCILFELITKKVLFRFSQEQRIQFLSVVKAINGSYPQDWLKSANAPECIHHNPENDEIKQLEKKDMI